MMDEAAVMQQNKPNRIQIIAIPPVWSCGNDNVDHLIHSLFDSRLSRGCMSSEETFALLRKALNSGGRLELSEVRGQQAAVAECLENGWLRRHHDRTVSPPTWLTLTPAGERLITGG